MSMAIKAKSNGRLNARFNDLNDDAPDCVSGAKSDRNLTLSIGTFYLWRLICRVRTAGSYYFEAGRQATGFRSFANGYTHGFTDRLLVRARRVTRFTATCASVANEGVRVQARIAPRFRRRNLARARSFDVTLSTQERIKAALAATRERYDRDVLRDLLGSRRFRSEGVCKDVRAGATFMQTGNVIRLRAVTRIHLGFALVVRPHCARDGSAIEFGRAFCGFHFLRLEVLIVSVFSKGGGFLCNLGVLELTKILYLWENRSAFSVRGVAFWELLPY